MSKASTIMSPRQSMARRSIPPWDRPLLQTYRPAALSHLSRRVEDLASLAPCDVPSFLRYKDFGAAKGVGEKMEALGHQQHVATEDNDEDEGNDERALQHQELDRRQQELVVKQTGGQGGAGVPDVEAKRPVKRFVFGEAYSYSRLQNSSRSLSSSSPSSPIWRMDLIMDEIGIGTHGALTESESQGSWGLLTSYGDSEGSEGLMCLDTISLEANEYI